MNLLVLFTALCTVGISVAEEQDLAKALAQGDVSTIVSYFDQTVEICMLNQTKQLDPTEAEQLLESFFKDHSPSAYQQIHRGDSKGASSYTIGLLTTQSGVFRIYLYYISDSTSVKIKEMRVDNK